MLKEEQKSLAEILDEIGSPKKPVAEICLGECKMLFARSSFLGFIMKIAPDAPKNAIEKYFAAEHLFEYRLNQKLAKYIREKKKLAPVLLGDDFELIHDLTELRSYCGYDTNITKGFRSTKGVVVRFSDKKIELEKNVYFGSIFNPAHSSLIAHKSDSLHMARCSASEFCLYRINQPPSLHQKVIEACKYIEEAHEQACREELDKMQDWKDRVDRHRESGASGRYPRPPN